MESHGASAWEGDATVSQILRSAVQIPPGFTLLTWQATRRRRREGNERKTTKTRPPPITITLGNGGKRRQPHTQSTMHTHARFLSLIHNIYELCVQCLCAQIVRRRIAGTPLIKYRRTEEYEHIAHQDGQQLHHRSCRQSMMYRNQRKKCRAVITKRPYPFILANVLCRAETEKRLLMLSCCNYWMLDLHCDD